MRNRSRLRWPALVAVAIGGLGLSACGGSNGKSSSDEAAPSADAKKGGEITVAYTSFPDFLDPATSYTVEGWAAMWNVYTPLLTYKHTEGADGSSLIPGLAEAMPTVSAGGKTYTLKLRQGLKFSDGTPVKASDFEHTIKRVLNLESGGSAFYFPIEGAEAYVKAGKADGDITGITADDATGEITIKLTSAVGSFSNVLAMDFAGIVPSTTKFANLSANPPPGVGPYKITSSKPTTEFTLEKNADFASFKIADIPLGNLDKINVKVIKNQRKQVQDTISGAVDYMNDPPPADQFREIKAKYADRYKEFVTNSTYYMFMNTRVAPFDKKEVRQAVNFALDKGALARIFGGLLEPGCNFLPPGMKGYTKIDPCPYGDPTKPPDIEKAKQLVQAAGVAGTEVNVFGNDEEPSKPVAEYVADVLTQIGFKAKPQIVEGSVYFQTIGAQKTKAQIGFANWFQDYPHPDNFMFLVDGKSIQETNNQNFGNVDDPTINAGIVKLKPNPDLDSVAGEWAALDKRLVDEALVAPYGHRKLTVFMSERMNFKDCTIVHPLYYADWAQFCLK